MSLRRASVQPGTQKKAVETSKRRLNSKESNKPGPGELPQIKEGDIFYKTIKYFPSIPDIPEDVSLTVTKPLEPVPPGTRDTPSSLTFGRRSASEKDRRGSVMPGMYRDEGNSPEEGSQRER